MTELKRMIENLKLNFVKDINSSGLALEIVELVLNDVHNQLISQIEKMGDENNELRNDNANRIDSNK